MNEQTLCQVLMHDLGRPIVFSQRWLGEDPKMADRWAAVCDDVLRTQRGPGGVLSALEIWQGFQESDDYADILVSEPGLRLAEVMVALGQSVMGLEGHVNVLVLEQVEGLAARVYRACQELKSTAERRSKDP
jgi:hypothetical protein